MVKVIDVLWLVEHVAREFDVACAVKFLVKNTFGIDIEIRHVYRQFNENMDQYYPKVVVHPFFYYVEGAAVIEAYVKIWPNAIHCNLAWEEIFYKGHLKIKAPSGNFVREKVIHHAWGNFYKEYLLSYGVEEKNIFVNGNPVFQLYLDPYRAFYKNRDELSQIYNIDPKKRWIFVPENYRWAFIRDDTIRRRVQQDGANEKELLGMREYAQESLAELLRWCNLVGLNKDIELIFRPKPATNLTEMQSFFYEWVSQEKSTGFHFIKGESVREWNMASDLIVSSFSTSLIEASIAGKPVFMIEPIPLIESFKADWYQYVPIIRQQSEFEKICFEGNSDVDKGLRAWAMTEMLANGDPIFGLASWVARQVEKQNKLWSPWKTIEAYKSGLVHKIKTFKKHKKNYFNKETHENDVFIEADVQTNIMKWKKVLQGKQ